MYLTVSFFLILSATCICENPEELIGDSVTVTGYIDLAVEGTPVTFHCPPGSVLDGPKINHQHVWRMGNGNHAAPYEI